ncbi:hypothetical protein VTJ83DRAFT_2158 [Remersonia thermophila]|uniref:Uncharacterized protein n=1 Tax=Remersonia thermophila TaxID=72144 RepID=A0ABR4DIX9_9PEZI
MARLGALAPIALSAAAAALLGGAVEAQPSTSRIRGRSGGDGQARPAAVQPRQWMFTPWLRPSTEATITITTLTSSGPGQTSVSSPTSTSTRLSETSSAPDLASLSTGTPASSSKTDAGVGVSSFSSTLEAPATPTDAMSAPSTALAEPSSPAESPPSGDGSDSAAGYDNRTLAIVLGSTISAFVLVVAVAVVLFCRRRRRLQTKLPFLKRGASPVDDDEIERWKSPRAAKAHEAGLPMFPGDTDVEADGALQKETGGRGKPSPRQHTKILSSVSSVKKPPSVIIYNTPIHTTTTPSSTTATTAAAAGRYSTDAESRRSFHQAHHRYHSSGGGGGGNGSRKTSFDKALPQTPIQARAPNSRAGLTDETVPGDDPFILPSPGHRRGLSRLSKPPPLSLASFGSRGGQGYRQHARTRSSRSSARSFAGDYPSYFFSGGGPSSAGLGLGGGGGGGGGGRGGSRSEVDLAPRYSHDQAYHPSRHARQGSSGRTPRSSSAPRAGGGDGAGASSSSAGSSGHSRVGSSSSIPPRLSLEDDALVSPGGLWPPPPRRKGSDGIGRAIG